MAQGALCWLRGTLDFLWDLLDGLMGRLDDFISPLGGPRGPYDEFGSYKRLRDTIARLNRHQEL